MTFDFFKYLTMSVSRNFFYVRVIFFFPPGLCDQLNDDDDDNNDNNNNSKKNKTLTKGSLGKSCKIDHPISQVDQGLTEERNELKGEINSEVALYKHFKIFSYVFALPKKISFLIVQAISATITHTEYMFL